MIREKNSQLLWGKTMLKWKTQRVTQHPKVQNYGSSICEISQKELNKQKEVNKLQRHKARGQAQTEFDCEQDSERLLLAEKTFEVLREKHSSAGYWQ